MERWGHIDAMGSHRALIWEEACCRASKTPTIRLTGETQSRLWLTEFGLEQLSITGSVVLASGLPETAAIPQGIQDLSLFSCQDWGIHLDPLLLYVNAIKNNVYLCYVFLQIIKQCQIGTDCLTHLM